MNFTLTSKVKSLLSYLVPVAMVSPSLIWIALDKSVWMWDEAIYGKGSVELFYMLSHSPKRWLRLIFNILHEQALEYPGWVNFLYRWVTYWAQSTRHCWYRLY